MKHTFLTKGASVIATAALIGCMVPAIAFADGSSSGKGTESKTTDDISVSYEKECSWTVSYPSSVSMVANGDSASASIGFTVTGLVDVDHQVTITPTSDTVTLTGQRHGSDLGQASITGATAMAADINASGGALVFGSASISLTDVAAAPVDTYSGTVTFKIECAVPDLSDPTKAATLTLSQFESFKSDPGQADYLAAYAETGKLKINGILEDDDESTATLVDAKDGAYTFMVDDSVTKAKVNNTQLTTGNFGDTVLYSSLAESGDIYSDFSPALLAVIKPQAKVVATNYNDAAGAATTTLTAQKLWLPSYSEIFGKSYSSSYNAGSTAEGAQLEAFKSDTYTDWEDYAFWTRSACYASAYQWLLSDEGAGLYANINSKEEVHPFFVL